MDGFEDVAVLHADAQALGLAFAGQLATQAAEVRIFGDLDLEHEQGVIAAVSYTHLTLPTTSIV